MARIADLMLEAGRARAAGELGAGQAWAGGVQNLGQALRQGLEQYQGQKQQDQATKLRDLQIEDAQLGIAGQKRAAADVGALDTAVGAASSLDPDAIEASLPGHLRLPFRKSWNEAESAKLNLGKAKTEAANAQADYFGALAVGVKPFLGGDDGGMSAAQIALQHAKEAGIDGVDEIIAHVKQHPQALPQLVEGLIAKSPTYSKLVGEAQTRELTRANQERDDRRATDAASETGRHNRELERIQGLTSNRAEETLKETQRHNQAMEATARTRANTASQDVTDLTPAGLDAAALNFAKSGTLPPLGMGDKNTRKQIINRAAEMMPGLDIASAKADFDANKQSLAALQKQRDALGAFEETALKNLDVFIDAAKKVADTGSPLLNRPLRSLSEKMLGGAELTAYNTARRTVIPEFAKILANPGLSGQLSDSARHEVEEVVSGNATLKQTIAAANILKTDAANRRSSYDDQLTAIRGRLTKASGAAAPSGVPAVGSTFNGGKVLKVEKVQ